jgi:hypothetical protein
MRHCEEVMQVMQQAPGRSTIMFIFSISYDLLAMSTEGIVELAIASNPASEVTAEARSHFTIL